MRRSYGVYIVEGPIAAGKSEFTVELAGALREVSGKPCLCLVEPASKDEEEQGESHASNPYLNDYYKDPARWAMHLQVHMLGERFGMHLHAQYHAVQGLGHAVVDRSYFGDVSFLECQRRLGYIDDREYDTYSRLYELMTGFVRLPTAVVHLMVDPEVSAERIRDRISKKTGRACEEAVDIGYLRMLNEEIGKVIGDLGAAGVHVVREHWNGHRPEAEHRVTAVTNLARYLHELPSGPRPRVLHRRRIV